MGQLLQRLGLRSEKRLYGVMQVEDKVRIEQYVLDTIGETTDPLADSALSTADMLPEPERTEFMRKVMRNLAIQVIYSTDNAEGHGDFYRYPQHAHHVGSTAITGYGTGRSFSDSPGNIATRIVHDALPVYEQLVLDA